jgi:hypothetical protein
MKALLGLVLAATGAGLQPFSPPKAGRRACRSSASTDRLSLAAGSPIQVRAA